ncbi:MAG: hypothetical protein E7404_05170 [Ruminococcaceae bacterium]|nr:hypothetical protein [Oscillospiraceae bacterium]
MKKEFIKNIVLALLIVSSISMTMNIWIDEKLWPDGYNFFSNITERLFGQKVLKNSGSLSKEKLALPKQLVINNASKRSVFFETGNEYDEIIGSVKEIFISALKVGEYKTADVSEWNAALKAKSIFVSYPVAYDSKILGDILGIEKINIENINIRDFVISHGDIASSNLNVYLKNFDNNSVLKCSVKYDKNAFDSLLTKYASKTTGDLPYSFELNLDKTNSDKQNVTIYPDVLLSIMSTEYNSLYSINPVYSRANEEFETETVNAILKNFDFNINTVRKYPEQDKSLVFVENYGSIKIHPSGYFEYRAIAPDKGIELPVSDSADYNEVFTASLNFVTDLWTSVVPQSELNLSLTSDITERDAKTFDFTMNYYVNGTLIRDDMQSSSGQIMPFGLSMSVSNGKITSYKQLIRIYYEGDSKLKNISTIEALDKLFVSQVFTKNDAVKEIFPAYVNNEGIYNITWIAKNQDNKTSLLR